MFERKKQRAQFDKISILKSYSSAIQRSSQSRVKAAKQRFIH